MTDNKNSQARIAANNRYNDKAYDRINIVVKKGKKEIIQAHAAAQGESVNSLINKAIDEKLERGQKEKASE